MLRRATARRSARRRPGPAASSRTHPRRKLIIAIDGPAGSGKSSTAKVLAKRLGLPYIDTGAMYRAVTLKAMKKGISLKDSAGLVRIARRARIELRGRNPLKQRVFLDGREVTQAIRDPQLTQDVFHVAKLPLVRREMVRKQRRMGKRSGAVMEGRDIGTVVFPNADFKFFFWASDRIRAIRRRKELTAQGRRLSLGRVSKDIARRDRTDYTRKEGPLRKASDAYRIDTSALTIEETVDRILRVIKPNPRKGFRRKSR